jgi:hypothetical protein
MRWVYLKILPYWYLIIFAAAWASYSFAFVVWGYPEGSSTLAGECGVSVELVKGS